MTQDAGEAKRFPTKIRASVRLIPQTKMLQVSRGLLSRNSRSLVSRKMSIKALEGDSLGTLATRGHHAMTTSLAVLTPLYFMVPDSYTDGFMNKMFGVLLTANITAHSWIGLNYVCTDYVPKVSKALLGPSRYVNAALAVVTFLGMSKMAIMSPGGIKGVVKGLWDKDTKKKDLDF